MPSLRLPARTLLPLAIAAGFALLLLIVPLPGSLSVVGTRWLSAAGAHLPGIELISEAGLLLLAAATALAMLHTWWRRAELRPRIVAAAVGVVLAYLLSEGGKVLFAQARPCTVWAIAGECPPPGDWSLPSNHATLAFGAATAIALVLGRSWITWATLALAAIVAVGRVVQGVHYVHDVALGAILGVSVPVLLVLAAAAMTRTRQNRVRAPRD